MSEQLMLGVMLHLREGNPEEAIAKVKGLGLPSCQLGWPPHTDLAVGQALQAAARAQGVTVTTLWAVLPGPAVWNFTEGPTTIGLVPPPYRTERVEALQLAAEVAGKIGIASITTHVGFIPEVPSAPLYADAMDALKGAGAACREHDGEFLYET